MNEIGTICQSALKRRQVFLLLIQEGLVQIIGGILESAFGNGRVN